MGRTSSFTSWLATLARNNLLDVVRMLEAEKRGGGRLRVPLGIEESSMILLDELLAGTSVTPSRDLSQKESLLLLERALEKLPQLYQQVVRLYDLEEKPVEEVARALEKSPGAVYMMRSRAHRRLRETLTDSL